MRVSMISIFTSKGAFAKKIMVLHGFSPFAPGAGLEPATQ